MANKFLSDINLTARLRADGNEGDPGQVLSSTGSSVAWINQNAITSASDFVFFNVKNETGSTILKGKGVMAVGTDGNSGHILIDEMVGDGTIEPKYFLGVLEEDIANGAFARVISFGMISQFDTRGQNGETWADGNILWCDPVNAGDFTITEPDGPNVKIAAAIILNSSTNGKIQVRVQANEGIHDLHDTKITSQVDGDVLVWNDTDGVWFNDSTLNVDYTSGRVGIGTTSPGTKLDVSGVITATGGTSTEWNTAHDWGDHDGLYLPLGGGALTGNLTIHGSTDDGGAVTPRTLNFTTNPTNAGLSGSNEYLIGEVAFTGKDSSTNASGKYIRIKGSLVDGNTTVQGSGGEGGKLVFTLLRHDAGAQPRVEYDTLTLQPEIARFAGDILPDADSTYDIGSNASKWAEGHFDHLYVGETGNNPRIDIYTENGTASLADTFSDSTTDKSYIYFQAGTNSNDPGFIMHETSESSSPDERNEGVLHLAPSDDNGYGDYVSIHGTNDADALKLHTNGRIETAENIQLDFLSGSGSVKVSDSLDVTGSITVAGTVDGVDISALPTSFAPTDAEANVQSDWNATSGDAFILNKPSTFAPSAHNHDDRYSRRYKADVVVADTTSFSQVCKVNGGDLGAAVRVSLVGTSGSVVVNIVADILVNHSQDIIVKSVSGIYTQLDIQIVSDSNDDFDIRLKGTGAVNNTTLKMEVHCLNDETVTFTTSTTYSGSTLTHRTKPAGSHITATGGAAGGYYIENNAVLTTADEGSGNGLDADLLDGEEGTHYLDYNNFTNTPTIPTDYVSAANGGTFSGDLYLDDGSGASPSIYFKNEDDNYWRYLMETGGNFSIKEGTSTRMTFEAGGNVGIGTTSPNGKLDIEGGMSLFRTTLTDNEDWQNSAISITERGQVGSTESADKYSPNLNFHWSSRVSKSLWMSGSGQLNWGEYSASGIPSGDGRINAATFSGDHLGTINTATTGTTQTAGDNSTKIATTAYVDAAATAVTSNVASIYDLLPAARVNYDWEVQLSNGVWTDVFEGTDELTEGVWMVKVFVDDHSVGGTQYDQTYSGLMSWGSPTNTNEATTGGESEIALHRSGHAANSGVFYLRTKEHTSASGYDLKLQGMVNKDYTGNSTINFKFIKVF